MVKMAMSVGLLVLVSVLPTMTRLPLRASHQSVTYVGLQVGQSLGCLGLGMTKPPSKTQTQL